MDDRIEKYLKTYKKSAITLSELEGLFPGNTEYVTFAGVFSVK